MELLNFEYAIIGYGGITSRLIRDRAFLNKSILIVSNTFIPDQHFRMEYSNITIMSRNDFLENSSKIWIKKTLISTKSHNWASNEEFVAIVKCLNRISPDKIILLSSASVYGHSLLPFKEGSEPNPINNNGINKLFEEKALLMNFDACESKVKILRISNVIGLFSSIDFIYMTLRNSINGEATPLMLGGELIRNYIFVNQLIELVVRIFESDFTRINQSINVGSSNFLSYKDLIKKISFISGLPIPVVEIEKPTEIPQVCILDTSEMNKVVSFSEVEFDNELILYIQKVLRRIS